MASNILPIGNQTVNGTVTLISLLSATQIDTTYPPPFHRIYLQADPTNTVQVDIKYAGLIICTLWKPGTTGPLPDCVILIDDNVANNIDITQITLTAASSSKIQGYLART